MVNKANGVDQAIRPRERVLLALNHREPDRVPIDLGTGNATSITVPAYERLKSHLNIYSPTQIMDRSFQVVDIEESILQLFSVDTRKLSLGKHDNWQDIELPDDCYQDEWGIIRRRSEFTYTYDVIKSPLSGEIGVLDILNYSWPDPHDPGLFRGLTERANALYSTPFAIVLPLGAGVVHQSQFLRGFEDWFVDLAWHPDLMGTLMDAILDIRLEIVRQALTLVGESIDIVFIGDDLGGQRSLLFSPQTYRRVIKPRHKRAIELIHNLTPAKVVYHTCGSVVPLIPDLIEIGVDALNPIQVSAKDMDTLKLKKEFGNDIAFWGAIDTHHVLPNGTSREIIEEVKLRVGHLAIGGGYVLAADHNIQPDVSPENIMTLFAAAQREGHYPIRFQELGESRGN
jgi:uroporphyrinogen decarboxylase